MKNRNNKGQFIVGHVEDPETKIKRINSCKKAWRKRKDYIGDIVNENPRIYNSWRSIMFNENGKKAGHSKEWNDFRTFYNDVAPFYKPGLLFRRVDSTKPFSKENFIWVDKDSIGDLRTNTIRINYNGETYTIKDWSDKLGIPIGAIRNRYHKHRNEYTDEEILFGKKTKRNSKVAKDIADPSINIRSKASKMISSYRNKDKRNGVDICDLTIDWMIDNILTKSCIYCGDTHRIGCDRLDNNKGHTKNNVVPCCLECNTARNNNFSFEEMKILGKTIGEIKNSRK